MEQHLGHCLDYFKDRHVVHSMVQQRRTCSRPVVMLLGSLDGPASEDSREEETSFMWGVDLSGNEFCLHFIEKRLATRTKYSRLGPSVLSRLCYIRILPTVPVWF